MIPASTNLWVEHLKGSACRRHCDAKDRQLLGRHVHRWAARTIQQNVGQQRERVASQRSGREHIDDERDVDRAAPHRNVRSDSQVIGPCRADSLERPLHLEMLEPRPESISFGPVFYWELGWRWLPSDALRTTFGHTLEHTRVATPMCAYQAHVMLSCQG